MSTTGFIDAQGVYHKNEKPDISKMKEDRNSQDKEYQHDRQREYHRRDTLQPYVNGQPNPEFVQQYPQESKQYGFRK
jgi:hypothetical protein